MGGQNWPASSSWHLAAAAEGSTGVCLQGRNALRGQPGEQISRDSDMGGGG